MLQLHSDPNFHYEAIRALARTRYYGADIAEVLNIIDKIPQGDFEAWYNEWHNLGRRVLSTIDESKPAGYYSPVTLKDVYFRASHYFFVADFFIHGNKSDPRLDEAYTLWRTYFDKANALLPIPGVHATIHTPHGFDVPVLVYRAEGASASNPRPTLIVGGGFDSSYEELLHVFGFPALERGYNVVLYEGPGQPTLIHKQNVGFNTEWEQAVTPIVDFLVANDKTTTDQDLSFIDTSKLALIGYSLGGYLAARAAAYEPRLAAVVCIDGVWSFGDCVAKVFPDCQQAFQAGDIDRLNELFATKGTPDATTNERWFHDHLKFSFCTDSVEEIFTRLSNMTLDGVANKISMPAFVGLAETDIFFLGQPQHVAREIGEKATLFTFTEAQACSAHCQSGAFVYLNQSILEWFAGVVGEK